MHKDTWYAVALFGGASAALLFGHLLFETVWYTAPETFETVVAVPLFAGLLFLGAGFFLRHRVRHLVTAIGWLVFFIAIVITVLQFRAYEFRLGQEEA